MFQLSVSYAKIHTLQVNIKQFRVTIDWLSILKYISHKLDIYLLLKSTLAQLQNPTRNDNIKVRTRMVLSVADAFSQSTLSKFPLSDTTVLGARAPRYSVIGSNKRQAVQLYSCHLN